MVFSGSQWFPPYGNVYPSRNAEADEIGSKGETLHPENESLSFIHSFHHGE
jgi:hypothetical protein